MKKKWFTVGKTISIILLIILITLIWSKQDFLKENTESANAEGIQIGEDKAQKEKLPDEIKDDQDSEERAQNKEEGFQNTNKGVWIEERAIKDEKIELTDYMDFPMEKFIEETGIPLHQDYNNENVWETEDDVICVSTDTENDRIISLSISRLVGNKEIKQLTKDEGFPYVLAGIGLNDEISYVEETVLKDACHENGMLNEEYYVSLRLSQLGIESLSLCHDENGVDSISVNYDSSLKENAENLEYIWEKRELRKSGTQNNALTVLEDSNKEEAKNPKKPDKIVRTDVRINYPHLEIPGEPEMTQNANNVILEAVKKIEDNTYGKTSENIIVTADYMIDYISSKFISISFTVYVTGNDGKRSLLQYCNINMGENGRKAYLADWGITKEKVAKKCYASGMLDPEDVEDYLEKYDTNWDKYSISIRKYTLFVKDLDRGNELQDREDYERLVKWYDWDIL